jgi:hypothetical protein
MQTIQPSPLKNYKKQKQRDMEETHEQSHGYKRKNLLRIEWDIKEGCSKSQATSTINTTKKLTINHSKKQIDDAFIK